MCGLGSCDRRLVPLVPLVTSKGKTATYSVGRERVPELIACGTAAAPERYAVAFCAMEGARDRGSTRADVR